MRDRGGVTAAGGGDQVRGVRTLPVEHTALATELKALRFHLIAVAGRVTRVAGLSSSCLAMACPKGSG